MPQSPPLARRIDPRWRRTFNVLAVGLFAVFLIGALLVVIAVSFAVDVNGHSMEPSVRNGERLFTNLLDKNVKRFDLVQGYLGADRLEVVKRVIGLPGDTISIEGGAQPTVYLQPAGDSRRYRVESTSWQTQIGDRTQACCRADGRRLDSGTAAVSVTIPSDSYWVIGDNWGHSDDSRVYGFLRKADVRAVLQFRVLPVRHAGGIPNPVRLVPAS